jgi:hypothetical protein
MVVHPRGFDGDVGCRRRRWEIDLHGREEECEQCREEEEDECRR